MAAKKKKLTNASASSGLSTRIISLSPLNAENQSPLGKKDQIIKRQEDEEVPRNWPLQPPMIEDCSSEKCSRWDSNTDSGSEGFLDDDMDFLPTGWGKDDKQSNDDEERAEIARKARLKKEKCKRRRS